MPTKLSLEPTRTSLLLVLSGPVVAALMCAGVGVVGFSMIGRAEAELTQVRSDLQDGRQNAQRLAAAEVKYGESLQQLGYLERSTSTRAYIPTLLKQLESLGRSLNLKVVSVRPVAAPPVAAAPKSDDSKNKDSATTAKAAAKPPYDFQKIDVSMKGSYNNALSFVYRLTQFPKILTVNSVEMSPEPTAGSSGKTSGMLEIRMNLTAFIFDGGASSDSAASAMTISGHEKELAEVGVPGKAPVK